MDKKIIVYFVAEHGFMDKLYVESFLTMFEKEDYIVEDIGMGSAYNMPEYLLGEIEEHREKAVVVSCRMEGDTPIPMVFFSEDEVNALTEALEKAEKGEDSFEILQVVHKHIRE